MNDYEKFEKQQELLRQKKQAQVKKPTSVSTKPITPSTTPSTASDSTVTKKAPVYVRPPDIDLISALQAAQLVLFANGWCKGTLVEWTLGKEDARSYCMLGAIGASGAPPAVNYALRDICYEMTKSPQRPRGYGLSVVNDDNCVSKEDAIFFMDSMIKYIDKEDEDG